MKRAGFMTFFAAFAAVLSLCGACTSVEMGPDVDIPDSAQVAFSVNWPEDMAESEKPDRMYLIMSRIINTVHYVYETDASGEILDTWPSQDVSQDVDAMSIQVEDFPNGDYYMMLFNDISASYKVDSLDRFASDKSISMRALVARAAKMTDEEADEAFGHERPDFNPSFPYIKCGGPLYIDVKKQSIYPDGGADVSFDMSSLTQALTFRLKVQSDEDIEISKLSAEISGVPASVELMSGKVRNDTTCRVIFDFEENGTEGGYKLYEGKINTFGLFPGENEDYITGPGILQIAVVARCEGYEKLFHASINMIRPISAAGLMETLSDGSGYRISRSEAELDVDAVLHITREQVIPGEDGQGIEIWFEKENIDVEL